MRSKLVKQLLKGRYIIFDVSSLPSEFDAAKWMELIRTIGIMPMDTFLEPTRKILIFSKKEIKQYERNRIHSKKSNL